MKIRHVALLSTVFVFFGYFVASSLLHVGPFNKIGMASGSTHIDLAWETDFPTKPSVEYGTSTYVLNESINGNVYETNHKMRVTNLLPGKSHYVRLVGEDELGNKYKSSFYLID